MTDETTPLITAQDAVIAAALAKVGGPPDNSYSVAHNESSHRDARHRRLVWFEHGDRKWFGVTYHWHHNGTVLQLHHGSYKDCEEDS